MYKEMSSSVFRWFLFPTLIVAGSTFEATEGQNITISFNIDEVEKADQVRITFKQDNKEETVVIAQQPWNHEETPPSGVSLLVEKGRLSVTIQNVSISRSGLYTAEAFFEKDTYEVNATLVVIEAAFSSTIMPPHSSTPKLLNNSSQLLWLSLIVAGSTFEATEGQNITIYFDLDEEEKAKEVRITFKQNNHEQPVVIAQQPWNHEETPPSGVSLLVEKGRVNVTIQNVSISRSGLYTAEAFFEKYTSEVNATLVVIDPECVKERIGKAIAISMNSCGENTEDLLTVS
ncbi:hypothetical protein DPX16_0379 [Anabarilius grahami]|uniref:Immunoglobulin domain-containing protein n=1 Tax=Anabarilius grahami TaxID=495550 RepID=A0A3N0Y4G7_ANAGA|nr:hypothetical protein DPX16_0379 [Anabarilius grahami]